MAGNGEPYKLAFSDELVAVTEEISRTVRDLTLDNSDITSTASVCRPFVLAIINLATTSIGLIEQRNSVALHILLRSLSEYTIDLMLLAYSNNEQYNRRFAQYALMVTYWTTYKTNDAGLESFRLRNVSNYRAYVCKEFAEVVGQVIASMTTKTADAAPISEELWIKIDKEIATRYKTKGWSGMSLPDRVKKIKLTGQANALLDTFQTRFAGYCNWTHPTPYALPEYDYNNDLYKLEETRSDEELFWDEVYIYAVIECSVDALDSCLPPSDHGQLSKKFRRLVNLTNKLVKHIASINRQGHATRTRDE